MISLHNNQDIDSNFASVASMIFHANGSTVAPSGLVMNHWHRFQGLPPLAIDDRLFEAENLAFSTIRLL